MGLNLDYEELLETAKQILVLRGGPTSGNWVHDGRAGKRGGSGRGGGFKRMRLKKGTTSRRDVVIFSRRNRRKRGRKVPSGNTSPGDLPKPKGRKPKIAPEPKPITSSKPFPKKPTEAKTKPGSAGKKVSEALDLSKVPKKGKVGPKIRSTIDIINSVHSDGNLKRIPVEVSSGKRTAGQYEHTTFGGRPVRITASRHSKHIKSTLAHEAGHFLDHQAVGSPGVFSHMSSAFFRATDKDKAVSEKAAALYGAMGKSQAMKTLANDTPKQSIKKKFSFHGQETEMEYKADRKYINYLLRPEEQFARAYAQYIATKSQDPDMVSEIKKDRSDNKKSGRINYHTTWEDKDFEPIKKSFDELFLEMGWLEAE